MAVNADYQKFASPDFRDNSAMSDAEPLLETLTAILYRCAAYAMHNLMDDAAMLAFIFS